MVKRLSQRKAINQVSGEKPLIRCHLSFKRKGVYEKSDSHRDEENRRNQSGMQINGCVGCVHLHFAMATKQPSFRFCTWATLLNNGCQTGCGFCLYKPCLKSERGCSKGQQPVGQSSYQLANKDSPLKSFLYGHASFDS
jgi:hypothetical protein